MILPPENLLHYETQESSFARHCALSTAPEVAILLKGLSRKLICRSFSTQVTVYSVYCNRIAICAQIERHFHAILTEKVTMQYYCTSFVLRKLRSQRQCSMRVLSWFLHLFNNAPLKILYCKYTLENVESPAKLYYTYCSG